MGSQTDRSMHMSAAHVQKLFIFSLMWSFGNLLELDGRVKLQDFMIRHPSKLIYPKLSGDWTIFEFLVDSSGMIFSESIFVLFLTLVILAEF